VRVTSLQVLHRRHSHLDRCGSVRTHITGAHCSRTLRVSKGWCNEHNVSLVAQYHIMAVYELHPGMVHALACPPTAHPAILQQAAHMQDIVGLAQHIQDEAGQHTCRIKLVSTHAGQSWPAHMQDKVGQHTCSTKLVSTHAAQSWSAHMQDKIKSARHMCRSQHNKSPYKQARSCTAMPAARANVHSILTQHTYLYRQASISSTYH
jgi:hypothetical protein